MKPLQIALLVVAGALGGAVVMKVWQRPQPASTPTPVVAQVETPAPVPAPAKPSALEPAPAPEQAVTPPTEPMAERPARAAKPKKAAPAYVYHPQPSHSQQVARSLQASRPQPVHRAEPVIVARSESPAAATPPQATPPPATPVTEPQQPPPPSTPPARTEPENVTPPAEPQSPPPPPEPEPPHKVTLNAGLLLLVRLVDGLSSERNSPGDTFTATLDRELVVDGFVIAERGARVEGRVVASDRGGKVRGVSSLAVALTRIRTSDGQNVAIQTDPFERHAENSQNQDATKVAGGAAVGAIIGAIAGGGKGAAIGAGVGGGAGAGDVLLTRGKPVTLPSETRLSFRLRVPVTLTEKRS